MRYAGIDITPEKKPAHVDSVVLDETDRKKASGLVPGTADFRKHAGRTRKAPGSKKLKLWLYERPSDTAKCKLCTIDKGEMVSIVGRNGAGKSTFSKLVCGFEDTGFRRNLLSTEKIC